MDDGMKTVTTTTDKDNESSSISAADAPIVKLTIQYQIYQDGGDFRNTDEKDVYLYELLIPVEDFWPSSSIAIITCDVIPCRLETNTPNTTTKTCIEGKCHPSISTTTRNLSNLSNLSNLMLVEGQSQSEEEFTNNNTSIDDNDQRLICQFGMPRSFDFTVSCCCSNQSTPIVLHYELDTTTNSEWMVCGNCAGYVTLQEEDNGKSVTVTHCDLIPLKCGLLQLPRLKVTVLVIKTD